MFRLAREEFAEPRHCRKIRTSSQKGGKRCTHYPSLGTRLALQCMLLPAARVLATLVEGSSVFLSDVAQEKNRMSSI